MLILTVLFVVALMGLFWINLNDAGFLRKEKWIVYLGHPLEQAEIWRGTLYGSRQEQLTETDGNVIDFSISVDGKSIAYSVSNQVGGSDIWLVSSSGKQPRRLVDCGADFCSQPAWDVHGRLIAYSRYEKESNNSDGISPERIWTVNVKSGRTGRFFKELEITGKSPAFSPDGNLLAFYDTSQHAIHLFNLTTGKSEFIRTQVEAVGSFSPDGTKMVFTDLDAEQLPPVQVLFVVDLKQKKVTALLGGDSTIIDASDPVWSRQGGWIAFSAQSSQIAGRQIWTVDENGTGLRSLSDDSAAVHAAGRWSLDGTQLIFQRLKLGSSENRPEVILLNMIDSRLAVLAEDAALPAWIP